MTDDSPDAIDRILASIRGLAADRDRWKKLSRHHEARARRYRAEARTAGPESPAREINTPPEGHHTRDQQASGVSPPRGTALPDRPGTPAGTDEGPTRKQTRS